MTKTKKSPYRRCIVALASFLASSVFLLSVHAKDIAHYTDTALASKLELHDLTQKAASELHDHVDKQVLKSFSKSFSDQIVASRNRDDDHDTAAAEDPGLLGHVHALFLMCSIYASLPFSLK